MAKIFSEIKYHNLDPDLTGKPVPLIEKLKPIHNNTVFSFNTETWAKSAGLTWRVSHFQPVSGASPPVSRANSSASLSSSTSPDSQRNPSSKNRIDWAQCKRSIRGTCCAIGLRSAPSKRRKRTTSARCNFCCGCCGTPSGSVRKRKWKAMRVRLHPGLEISPSAVLRESAL